jgi:hypothetical protein
MSLMCVMNKRLPLIGLALVVVFQGSIPAAENAAIEERMRKDITYLASDACEGRGVATQGINLAADYIAQEFAKAGLKPAMPNGSYFQPFTINGGPILEGPNQLILKGPLGQEITLVDGGGDGTATRDKHFQTLGLSGTGKLSAPLVFVGYGLSAEDAGYDDYQDVDVVGKIVVLLRKTPRPDNSTSPFGGNTGKRDRHGALTNKITNADLHKAAAVLFVNDAETAKSNDALMTFDYSARGSGGSTIPALQVRRAILDAMLQSSRGIALADLERDIDRELKPRSVDLRGWMAHIETNVRRPKIEIKNVVGFLEGEGPKANETIVIGAHYDHLGMGELGSLARSREPAIHHGADDNGSGTSTIMELARRFGQMPKRERRLLFIAFTGEERGLLGSAYYCKNPLFPLEDTITMVNLDMVGRLRQDNATSKEKLTIYGTGTAKSFDKLVDQINEEYDFKLQKVAGGFGPSDHSSFYAKNIPVFFFFTGDHPDYHRPSDTADKINVAGMRKVADMTDSLVVHLLKTPERPEYVKVAGRASMGPRVSGIPTIGIRPGYGEETEGVLLEGVTEDGPAAKAGLKTGDRIVEIGGQAVKNIESYMVVMGKFKKGDTIEMSIIRDGKKQTVKVQTR